MIWHEYILCIPYIDTEPLGRATFSNQELQSYPAKAGACEARACAVQRFRILTQRVQDFKEGVLGQDDDKECMHKDLVHIVLVLAP